MSSDTNPQPKKVVAVNAPITGTVTTTPNQQGNVINRQTGGRVPDQPVTNTTQTPPKQSGGGPEGPATQNTAGLANAVNPNLQAPTEQNPDNIDIDKFIADSTTEVKVFDEKEKARKEKVDYLNRILELRNKFRRIVFNNAETQEFVGTKIQYEKDEDGKTIYDYVNDPVVAEHIQFVVPEDDPQDGSPVNRQISFFWKKPTF
jgi:hypothetical protein